MASAAGLAGISAVGTASQPRCATDRTGATAGQLWKQIDPCFGPQVQGDVSNLDRKGKPHWSWTQVHLYDYQANRMSAFHQVKQISGGYKSRYEVSEAEGGEKNVYDTFLTQAAIARLGAV